MYFSSCIKINTIQDAVGKISTDQNIIRSETCCQHINLKRFGWISIDTRYKIEDDFIGYRSDSTELKTNLQCLKTSDLTGAHHM